MSNIEENLQKILDAVYGEEVRGAIHDAIHDCYEDGKAGAVDLTARELIRSANDRLLSKIQSIDDTLSSQISNLVSNEGSTDKDSEIVDARVGANGKIYSSVGDSMRGQIKNIVNDFFVHTPTFNKGRSLNEYGQETISGNWVLSDWIPVFKDQQITIVGYSGVVALFDNEKTLESFQNVVTSPYVKENVSVLPSKNGYLRFSMLNNGSEYDVDFANVGVSYHLSAINSDIVRFLLSGRCISDVLGPTDFGLNLVSKFSESIYEPGIWDSNGNAEENPSYYRCTNYIPINDNVPYWIYAMYVNSGCFYDKDFNFIAALHRLDNIDDGNYITNFAVFFPPSQAKYLRINCSINDLEHQCIGYGSVPLSTVEIERTPSIVEAPYLKTSLIESEEIYLSGKQWRGKTCAVIGDSISYQDGKPYTQEGKPNYGNIAVGWQTILKKELKFSLIDNYAISGQSMASGTANEGYAGSGINTVQNVDWEEKRYDLVIIAHGTNDFKLNVPIGDITDEITTTFLGAYVKALKTIYEQSPSTSVILFTPLHRNNDGYDSFTYQNSAGYLLKDYVNQIVNLGKLTSSPVCDMFGNCGINYWNVLNFTMDGLHLDDLGYEKMGSYAVNFLKTIPCNSIF